MDRLERSSFFAKQSRIKATKECGSTLILLASVACSTMKCFGCHWLQVVIFSRQISFRSSLYLFHRIPRQFWRPRYLLHFTSNRIGLRHTAYSFRSSFYFLFHLFVILPPFCLWRSSFPAFGQIFRLSQAKDELGGGYIISPCCWAFRSAFLTRASTVLEIRRKRYDENNLWTFSAKNECKCCAITSFLMFGLYILPPSWEGKGLPVTFIIERDDCMNVCCCAKVEREQYGPFKFKLLFHIVMYVYLLHVSCLDATLTLSFKSKVGHVRHLLDRGTNKRR